MPYTDDPANVPTDQVRFFVGDTSVTSPDLTDAEINFLLLEENGNSQRAAARAAEALAARYTKKADSKKVGPLAIIQSNRNMSKAQEFAKLALRLWARAGVSTSGPYAGGISIMDKNARVMDSDRVPPSFTRKGLSYPGSDLHDTGAERLSPPEVLP